MTYFFTLSDTEAEATQRALDILRGVPWAAPLAARIGNSGGLSAANMPFLFEARCALALHDCGITPEYVYAAGVGDTTVDFRFGPWLVELYSLDESEALKAATWQKDLVSGRVLATYQPAAPEELERAERKRKRNLALLDESSEHDAVKQAIRREIVAEAEKERQQREGMFKQSPEAEIVKAIERVVGKATHGGQPAKFPIPDGSRVSMLVVDARALGVAGPDLYDCRLIAYGADAVPEFIERQLIVDGRAYAIRGAFDPHNPMRAVKHFRERVHFLGIVAEETYDRDELQYFICFYPNPNLFRSREEACAVLTTFPLFQPGKVREHRPELFLDEMTRRASPDEIEFGVLTDKKIVQCRVHRDTLEDIEKRCLDGASEMDDAFERHKHTLRHLVGEKNRRDQLETNGTAFLRPADLSLLR